MNLEDEVMTLRIENKRLNEKIKLLEHQHQLDLTAEIRMRRQVDFLMESQGLKKEEPKEEIWDDQ